MNKADKQKFRLDPPIQARLWDYAVAIGEKGRAANQTRIVNRAVEEYLGRADEVLQNQYNSVLQIDERNSNMASKDSRSVKLPAEWMNDLEEILASEDQSLQRVLGRTLTGIVATLREQASERGGHVAGQPKIDSNPDKRSNGPGAGNRPGAKLGRGNSENSGAGTPKSNRRKDGTA